MSFRLTISLLLRAGLTASVALTCAFSYFAQPKAEAQSTPRTYYVATNGDNANNGLSASSAFATIGYAAAQTAPGDTVLVEDGTYSLSDGGYRGDAAIASNGAAGKRITYKAQNKWKAKLVGRGTGDGSTVIGISGAYNIIQDFDITGTDANGIILASTGTSASFNQAIGNYVHDLTTPCDQNGGAALNTGGGSNYAGISNDDFIGNLVVNIRVPNGCTYTSTDSGIYEAVPYGVVANNIVMNVAGAAIQSWHNAHHLTFFGNVALNSYDGIVVGDGDAPGGVTNDYTSVRNNIAVNNSYCGICEGGSTGAHNTYTDNLSYGNHSNILLKNGLVATGTVTADPQFVNNTGTATGDYRLQSTSPARGTGLALAGIATDYLGIARPQSGTTDIGACLFSTASAPPPSGAVAAGISASSMTVAPGGSTTLTWNTVNAVSADLNGTPVPLKGSRLVYPTATTAYRITGHSATGATDAGQITVTVGTATAGAVAAGISASSMTVAPGGSTTLTWNTVNAVSADLNGTPVPLKGSRLVYPTATTAYRITGHSATGATDAGQITVTVK